jgi:cytochrome c
MTSHSQSLGKLFAALLASAFVASPVLASDTFEQAKIAAGESLFNQECRRCHAPDADHASYGPALSGVIGRKAGTYPDFTYSDALANASFVWTPAALRAWMEDNTHFIPGTRMRHVGITDPTVQDFILTYLGSLPASQ